MEYTQSTIANLEKLENMGLSVLDVIETYKGSSTNLLAMVISVSILILALLVFFRFLRS